MATIDTDLLDALTAANVPADKARAAAAAIERRIAENTVTNLDLGAVADRLETKIETEIGRLETKISSDVARLESKIDTGISMIETRIASEIRVVDAKIDSLEKRMTLMQWMVGVSILLCLAILGRVMMLR